MRNAYDVLTERGFIKQSSHPEELHELLGKERVTFYIGFDPTADSLHIGHYVALMTMAHMQRCGHRPIVLLGGGTAAIGDPSGKTDMRRMMTREELDHNAACFQKQMARLVSFEGENAAILANNADWLRNLNFLDFMRDIGVHFSVNQMLRAECYKQRMERGLTFFEMGYMLMQSYDFLVLNQKYGCCLEMGGDDFLAKPYNNKILLARIMANIRRVQMDGAEPSVNGYHCTAFTLDANSHSVEKDGRSVHLADMEYRILTLFVRYPNTFFTANELYQKIWGKESLGDVRTVQVHIHNLRSKIEPDPAKPVYLKNIWGKGYVFQPDGGKV